VTGRRSDREATVLRDLLATTLGASVGDEDDQLHREAEERRMLQQQRRALSPEALAGDEAALAELDRVETRLAELDRRERLRELAEAEQADRARRAGEAEAERQRKRWRRQKADLEQKRDGELARIEEAISALVSLIPTAIRLDSEAETLGKQLDPGYQQARIRRAIENRLSRQLRGIGILDLPPVRNTDGTEPLATLPNRNGRRRG